MLHLQSNWIEGNNIYDDKEYLKKQETQIDDE